MKKTFSIISLGCPRNLADSEFIISEFRRKGYVFKEEVIGSDTVIINTCAFVKDAKEESIDTILKVIEAKKEGSVKKIVVAGCLIQRYPNELKNEFKEIDELRGILDPGAISRKSPLPRLTPNHYSYVKISEGCQNRCRYCIIPHIKGQYRSRKIEDIIEDVKKLIHKGAKEIILVGQDTSLYGIDLYGRKRLAELLERLDKISEENWIRLLYSHPANLEKDVIKIIGTSRHICKYVDLPVEHISDEILKRMGRRTKRADIVSLIKYIRDIVTDVVLRTSVIVGFPGETEKDFQKLLSFIKETKFERLGLFKYSKEEGTPAYRFKDNIPEKEKEKRFNEVMLLQQEISSKINERFKGKVMKVLIEEETKDCYLGRTEYDAPEVDGLVYVYPNKRHLSDRVNGGRLKIGRFYNVQITDTYEYDLVGNVVHITISQ